jgi:hypothetical protein
MKLIIELLRIGNETMEVLTRAEVNVISPKWAKARAHMVLNSWKQRNANAVRIVNREGAQIYYCRED